MKPAVTISAVVVAVLVTVVIEETRIKKLEAEIERLRSLPDEAGAVNAGTDSGGPPAMADSERETDAPEAGETDAGSAETAPAVGTEADGTGETAAVGTRQVPEDFPAPDEESIKALALSSYAPLHYELGLNNRERAYLDHLLDERKARQQELAGRWVEASEAERAAIEDEMEAARRESDQAIRTFLDRDEDFVTFQIYRKMQPSRLMLEELRPLMDQKGVALEMEEERKAVAAMHEARDQAGATDWESTKSLDEIVAGNALESFEEEWADQTAHLKETLTSFLSEEKAEALLESRAELKSSRRANLEAAVEAVEGGTSE